MDKQSQVQTLHRRKLYETSTPERDGNPWIQRKSWFVLNIILMDKLY